MTESWISTWWNGDDVNCYNLWAVVYHNTTCLSCGHKHNKQLLTSKWMLTLRYLQLKFFQNKTNSTEVQNPWCKLDDKCLCLSYVCSCLCKVCSCVSEALLLALWTLSLITFPQTVRLFYISLHSQAPQQQYTIYCMHYSITLWAYLSVTYLEIEVEHIVFHPVL